jgi:N-acetyl-anhydromuramyl-L-alanine amidase AmpD
MCVRRGNCLMLLILLAGCGGTSMSPQELGPVGRSMLAASIESGVPRDLLIAIASVEGGLRLPRHRTIRPDDHVPVAGMLELRHGAFNSLRRGAALLGVSEQALQEDTDLGTRAGALVLADLAHATSARSEDLWSFAPAVATFSGFADVVSQTRYVHDVMEILRRGGRFTAWGGESIWLPPHPKIEESGLGVAIGAVIEAPEFPPAMWVTTSCVDKCNPSRSATVDTIIVHDTEAGWNASLSTLQYEEGKSVHYLIDGDGSRVAQFVHESVAAWHSGNHIYNDRSIGIEHVGVASDPDGYDANLYAASVELVESIRSRFDIPLDRQHIIGHYQVPNGDAIGYASPPCSGTLPGCEFDDDYGGSHNHRDPGLHWQWCQYMEKLGGFCECGDAYSHFNCTTDKTEAVRCTRDGKVEILHCADGCEVQPIGVDDLCHGAREVVDDREILDGGTTERDAHPAARDANEGAAQFSGSGCSMSTQDNPTSLMSIFLAALMGFGLFFRLAHPRLSGFTTRIYKEVDHAIQFRPRLRH